MIKKNSDQSNSREEGLRFMLLRSIMVGKEWAASHPQPGSRRR